MVDTSLPDAVRQLNERKPLWYAYLREKRQALLEQMAKMGLAHTQDGERDDRELTPDDVVEY